MRRRPTIWSLVNIISHAVHAFAQSTGECNDVSTAASVSASSGRSWSVLFHTLRELAIWDACRIYQGGSVNYVDSIAAGEHLLGLCRATVQLYRYFLRLFDDLGRRPPYSILIWSRLRKVSLRSCTRSATMVLKPCFGGDSLTSLPSLLVSSM